MSTTMKNYAIQQAVAFAKGKEILEGNCGLFNSSKKTQKKTLIFSALASKKWSKQKIIEALYYVKLPIINIIKCPFFH